MAEVVGLLASTLTTAGLLKLCIDAFDLINTGRERELEFEKLIHRLKVEQFRLYLWGDAMRIV